MQQIIELITVINNEQSYLGLQELEKQINKITNIDIKVNPIETKSVEKSVKQLNNLLRNPLKIKVDDTRLFELNDHYDEKIVDHNKVVDNAENNPIKVKYTEEDKTTDKDVNNKESREKSKKESNKTESDKKENKFQEDRLAHVLQSIIDEGIKDGVNLMLRGLPPAISKAIANPFTNFLQGFTGGLGNDVLQWVKGKVNQNINKPQTAEIIDFPQLNQSTSGGELTRYNPKIDGGNGVIDVDFSEIKSKEKAESNIINFPDNFKAKTIIVDSLKVQNLRNFKLPPSVKNIQVKDENINSLNREIFKDPINEDVINNDIKILVPKLEEIKNELTPLKLLPQLIQNQQQSLKSSEEKPVKSKKEELSYKELKTQLKDYKKKGLTDVKLNSSKKVLQSEFDRIKTVESQRQNKVDNISPTTDINLDQPLLNVAEFAKEITRIAFELKQYHFPSASALQKSIPEMEQGNFNDYKIASEYRDITKMLNAFNNKRNGNYAEYKYGSVANNIDKDKMNRLYQQWKPIESKYNKYDDEKNERNRILDEQKQRKEDIKRYQAIISGTGGQGRVISERKVKRKGYSTANVEIPVQSWNEQRYAPRKGKKVGDYLVEGNGLSHIPSGVGITERHIQHLVGKIPTQDDYIRMAEKLTANKTLPFQSIQDMEYQNEKQPIKPTDLQEAIKLSYTGEDDNKLAEISTEINVRWEKAKEEIKQVISELEKFSAKKGYKIQKNLASGSPGLIPEILARWTKATPKFEAILKNWDKISAEYGDRINLNLINDSKKYNQDFAEKIESRAKTPQQVKREQATTAFSSANFDEGEIISKKGKKARRDSLPKLETNRKKRKESFAQDIENRASTKDRIRREQIINAFLNAEMINGEILSEQERRSRQEKLPKLTDKPEDYSRAFAKNIQNRQLSRKEQALRAFGEAEYDSMGFAMPQQRRMEMSPQPNHVLRLIDSINNLIDSIDKAQSQLLLPSQQMRLKESEAYKKNQQLSNDLGFFVETDLQRTVEQSRLKNITDESEVINRKPKNLPPVDEMLRVVQQGKEIRNTDLWDLPIEPKQKPQYPDNYLKERQKRLKNLVSSANLDLQNLPYSNKQLKNQKLLPSVVSKPNTSNNPVTVEVVNTQDILSTDLWTDKAINVPKFVPDSPILMREGEKKNRELLSRKYGFFVEPYLQQKPYQPEEIPDFWNQELPKLKRPLPYTVNDKGEHLKQFAENIANRLNEQELLDDQGLPPEVARRRRQVRRAFADYTEPVGIKEISTSQPDTFNLQPSKTEASVFKYITKNIAKALEQGLSFKEIKSQLPKEITKSIPDIDKTIKSLDLARMGSGKIAENVINAEVKELFKSFNINKTESQKESDLQSISKQLLDFISFKSSEAVRSELEGKRLKGAGNVQGAIRTQEQQFARSQGMKTQNGKLIDERYSAPIHSATTQKDLVTGMVNDAWFYGDIGVKYKKDKTNNWMSLARGDSGLGQKIESMPRLKSGEIDYAELFRLTEETRLKGKPYTESRYWGNDNPEIESLYIPKRQKSMKKGTNEEGKTETLQDIYKTAYKASTEKNIPIFYEQSQKEQGMFNDLFGKKSKTKWVQLSNEALKMMSEGVKFAEVARKLGKKAYVDYKDFTPPDFRRSELNRSFDLLESQKNIKTSYVNTDDRSRQAILQRQEQKLKAFSIAGLNTRGNVNIFKQTEILTRDARRLSRDLQRAVSLGFEDTKGDVTRQVEQIKLEIESLNKYQSNFDRIKEKTSKLESRQEYKKDEEKQITFDISALEEKRNLPTTSAIEKDEIDKNINNKQLELARVIEEQIKLQQLITKEKLKEKQLEVILNREKENVYKQLKNTKKELENDIAESNPQVFRQLEDRVNRARIYQTERQIRGGMEGTRDEQNELLEQVAGYGASLGVAFAPISTAVAALSPVLLNLLPTIMGISGAFNMLSPVVNQARENMLRLSTIQNRFNVVSVDKNVKSSEFDYVRNLSRDLSLNAEVLTEQYTKLYSASVGTRMQGSELKQLFEGVATSVRALNLTTYESELVFNAYSQILSKGKLSMEELRQQLGEKFPPAMSIFAKSLGVSVGELDALTSRGALLSDEVLPKIAKTLKQDYGGIVEKSFGSFSSQLAKLENEIFNFNINLVNSFEGMFSSVTGILASLVRVVNDSFSAIGQYFGTSVIGITAILTAGTSAIMGMPQVTKLTASLTSILTASINKAGKLLLPTLAGIAVDAVPFMLGAENSVMENMSFGSFNWISTGIAGVVKDIKQFKADLMAFGEGIGNLFPDVDNPQFTEFLDTAINGVKTLGNLLKSSLGTVELFALIFMFEQLAILTKIYIVPQFSKLATGFTNLAKNIKSGTFSLQSFKNMMGEILPVSTRLSIGIFALEAGIADLFVSFAKGDLGNPLYDTLSSTYKSTNNLTDALSGLVKEFASLNNEVKQFNKLTPKGFETSFKAKYLGDKSSSKLSDELITSVGKRRFEIPFVSSGIRQLAIPTNAVKSLLGSKRAKIQLAQALGAGGNPVTDLQRETLTKNNLENFIPENKRETIALRNLVFDLDTGEKTLKDFQADIDKIGFNPDKLGANIPKIKATITDVINSINEDLYKKSGLDESLINEFKTLDSIEKIDAKLLELGQKRVPLALDGTPTALEEIRKIDVQLRALENVRKNAVIEVVTKTEQLDEYEKTIKDTIEEIERQNDPFEVEQAKIKPYQEILDIIQKIRQELDKGGVSDLLKPLEDVFQKVKITVGDSQTLFDKFIRENKIGLSNDIAEIYQSNPIRQQVSVLVDSKTLARNRDELAKVTEQLNLLIEQRKILEALPIGAEGDPRSEEKQNIKDEINRLKDEQATLGQTVAQSNYELAESIRQQRISARDFTRQLVDFDLQVKDYFINRSRQLQDFEKNFTDTSIQNQRGARDLVESFKDLRNTLNTNILNINNQLITAKNQLSNLSNFNEIRSNFKLGSNGLLNQFTTLLEGIFTSEESLNEQTRNLEEERLALQQETTDYTRQIRGLGEQAYDLERDRINQLIDLTRQQDDFIKEQNNSWRDITKTAEDLAVSAKEWGVQFTSIADILINITGMYERLQSQINDSVNNMQTATSVLPYADSVEVGKLGSTGSSTAPHLHFEVIAPNGQALNPKNTDYYNKVMIGNTAINQMGINSGHGMRKHPIKGIQKFHTGIDVGGQNNLGQNITLNIPTSEIKKIEQKNDVGGYGKYTDVTLMNDYKLRFAHLLEHGKQLTEITSNLTKTTNNFNRDDAKSIASAFIKQEEGFRDKAYFDVNRYRIGYGTEFKGDSPNSYRASSTITKAEADYQLENYDIPRFTDIIKGQLGDTFNQLSEQIKASLISVSYNYGSLPPKVVNAVKTKNTATIANSIRTLKANPERRNREADLVLSSSQNKIKGVAPNDRTTNQHSNLSSISSRNSISNISSSSEFKSVEKQIKKVITTFPDTVSKAIANVDRPTVKSLIEFLDKGQKIPTDLLREVLNLKDMGNYEGALELMKTQVKDFTQLKSEFIDTKQKQIEEQRISEQFQKAQELRQNVITVNETIRNIENNYTQLQQSIKQAQIETQGFTTTQQSLDMAVFETKNKYRDLRQQVRSFGQEIENSLDVINLDNLDKAKEELTLLKDKLALNLSIIPDGSAKEKMQEFIGLIEKGLAENVNATELLITLKAKFDKLGLEEQLNQAEKEAEINIRVKTNYESLTNFNSELSGLYSTITTDLKELNMVNTATNFEISSRKLESINKYNKAIYESELIIKRINKEIAENPANKEYLEAELEQAIKFQETAIKIKNIEEIRIPIIVETQNSIDNLNKLSNFFKSIGEIKAEIDPFFGGNKEKYISGLLDLNAKYKQLELDIQTLANSEQNLFSTEQLKAYSEELEKLREKDLKLLNIKMSATGQVLYEPLQQGIKESVSELIRGTKSMREIIGGLVDNVTSRFTDMFANLVTQGIFELFMPNANPFNTNNQQEIATNLALTGFTEFESAISLFGDSVANNAVNFGNILSTGANSFSNAIASSTDILSSSLGNFLNGILSGGGGGSGLLGTLASSALSGITGGIMPSFGGNNYSFAEGIKLKGYSMGGKVEKIPMINNFSQGGKVQEVMIPNFSMGGEIMPQIENFSDGGQVKALSLGLGIMEAMKREGANAVPVVAYAGESFLSHKTGDAQLYEDLKRTGVWDMFKHNPSDIPDVKNYEYGGTVERTYSKMTNNSSTNTYNNSRSKETNNNSRVVENHNYYFQNKDPFVGSSSYLKQRQKLGR